MEFFINSVDDLQITATSTKTFKPYSEATLSNEHIDQDFISSNEETEDLIAFSDQAGTNPSEDFWHLYFGFFRQKKIAIHYLKAKKIGRSLRNRFEEEEFL